MKLHLCHLLCTLTLLLLLLQSCQHRPLVEMGNTHYVRVYINDTIKNTTYQFYNDTLVRPDYKEPGVMRVTLNDQKTGAQVAESFLQHTGRDQRGYYLDGYLIADAGDYDLMMYNIGTETTNVRDVYNYNTVTAYTNEIQSQLYARIPQLSRELKGEKIAYIPDHLFVTTKRSVHLPFTDRIDTIMDNNRPYFDAPTLVKTYYLQVRVKGIQYVTSAVSLISGMAGSSTLSTRSMVETDSVLLYMEMDSYELPDEPETSVIYTSFNTFGKLPKSTSRLTVTFEFITLDGNSQVETIDITNLFQTLTVEENQWILIDKIITINPPEKPKPGEGNGGFSPGIDDWDNIHSTLPV